MRTYCQIRIEYLWLGRLATRKHLLILSMCLGLARVDGRGKGGGGSVQSGVSGQNFLSACSHHLCPGAGVRRVATASTHQVRGGLAQRSSQCTRQEVASSKGHTRWVINIWFLQLRLVRILSSKNKTGQRFG